MVPALLLLIGLAALQPADFAAEERSERLDFRYSWPAEAGALPGLRAALERDLAEARSLVRSSAEAGGRGRAEYSQEWEVNGRSDRLISLSAESYIHHAGASESFTNYAALLWDRTEDRAIPVETVLGTLGRFTERYCGELDRERYEKSEGLAPEGETAPDGCPGLDEQTIVLADLTDNGRFDTLLVMMSPGIAGPRSDGPYFVEVGLEESDLAAVPATYRAGFERRE